MKRIDRGKAPAARLTTLAALPASTGAHGCTFLIAAGQFADGGRR